MPVKNVIVVQCLIRRISKWNKANFNRIILSVLKMLIGPHESKLKDHRGIRSYGYVTDFIFLFGSLFHWSGRETE